MLYLDRVDQNSVLKEQSRYIVIHFLKFSHFFYFNVCAISLNVSQCAYLLVLFYGTLYHITMHDKIVQCTIMYSATSTDILTEVGLQVGLQVGIQVGNFINTL